MINLLQLIGADVRLKKSAATEGGEWKGPCPFCGGKDRFWVQPKYGKSGRWRCRQCDRGGDAYRYVMEKQGVGFREAKHIIEGEPILRRAPALKPETPKPDKVYGSEKPSWQTAVREFVRDSANVADDTPTFWDWVAKRGISQSVAVAAELGASKAAYQKGSVSFYRGIVIPIYEGARIAACKVRTGKGQYFHIKGGDGTAVYGLDKLPRNPGTGIAWAGNVAILVETELDALMLRSVLARADDPQYRIALGCVTPLALGSATGGRKKSADIIGGAAAVLVALDADEAGDKASEWWTQRGAKRLRPTEKDPGEMYEIGGGPAVLKWIQKGLDDVS